MEISFQKLENSMKRTYPKSDKKVNQVLGSNFYFSLM